MPAQAGAVTAHTGLREVRYRRRELARRGERLPRGHHAVGEADGQRFLRIDRAAGEDEVHRAALADQPRQAHRAAVDQRHTPAAAKDTEHRRLVGHAQVAP